MILRPHNGHDDAPAIFIPQSQGKKTGSIKLFTITWWSDEKKGRQHPVCKKDNRRRIIPTINLKPEKGPLR
jgi:hypothetical protein